jgi:hypothetical protein
VLVLQREVAQAVASEIAVQLDPRLQARLRNARSLNSSNIAKEPILNRLARSFPGCVANSVPRSPVGTIGRAAPSVSMVVHQSNTSGDL